MVDPRPALYLIKQDEQPKTNSKPLPPRTRKGKGSSITIEAEHGKLLEHSFNALTPEDALALLSGLSMILVRAVAASQGF